MVLPLLASVADLEARLGRSLTAETTRATALLRDASAAVRRFTGQEITSRRSTVRALVSCGGVVLPQQPVTAVHGVVTIPGTLNGVSQAGGAVIAFSWYSGALVDAASPTLFVTWPSSGYVEVDYTHGLAAVPDEIIAVVCQVAGRAFGTPSDQAGTTAETVGSYSRSTGGAAAAGPLGLLDDERRILAAYRAPQRPIQTMGRW